MVEEEAPEEQLLMSLEAVAVVLYQRQQLVADQNHLDLQALQAL